MSYTIGACNNCGFIYAYYLPEAEIYAKYYTQLSKYDFAGIKHEESLTDKLRADAAIQLVKPHLASESIIADIGCGIGYLLSCFLKQGYRHVYGIDPGSSSPTSALRCFGLDRVYTGVIAEVASLIPISEVTLVTLTGVLEHLWDPRSDIRNLVRSMKIGSCLLVEVPALEEFDASSDEPFGELSLEHLQFFSTNSLNMFMNSLGLTVLRNTILPLPKGASNSLFGLYQVAETPAQVGLSSDVIYIDTDANRFSTYLRLSSLAYEDVISKVPESNFIIYGAGSHTCRLIAAMPEKCRSLIVRIVDSNPNLLNKYIGKWEVSDPACLSQHPNIPIVISSYRSQASISRYLASNWPNRIIHLY